MSSEEEGTGASRQEREGPRELGELGWGERANVLLCESFKRSWKSTEVALSKLLDC